MFFFVLSGYLITGLLVAEIRATSRINLMRFYARRARRLLPACVLVLAATALVAAAVFAPQEMTFTGRAALSAGLYMSNVFFDRSAADYFAPNVAGNPLLHTWSLGLEEQFYLLWPLLILLTMAGLQGSRRLIWIMSAVAAVSFTCCLYATARFPSIAFYELPARAWEFAAGGVVMLLPVSRTGAGTRWAVAGGFVGIALILATCILVKRGADFPGWIALFPVAGTLATLCAGSAAPQRGISALLGAAPLQFIGSRSYAWYLWHWPFVVFMAALVPGVTLGGRLLAAGASLLAATLTFSFVERPIRENSYLGARPGLSLRLAAVATSLAVGAAWALLQFGQHLGIDAAFRSLIAAETDVADMSIKACVTDGDSLEVKTCSFGAADARDSLVLFGDSHALQWFDAFRAATHMEAWRLITLMKFGCAASDINPHRLSVARNECRQWRRRAIDKIVALHPAAVVMASYTGATIRGFRAEAPMSAAELGAGTRRTFEELSHAGIPVILLRDTPLPPFEVPACVARQLLKQPQRAAVCNFAASAALDDAAYAAERAAADGLPNIHFLDLSDQFCLAGSCAATQHGLLVYRDDNHLSGAFAKSLAPVVQSRLFQLLRDAPYRPVADRLAADATPGLGP